MQELRQWEFDMYALSLPRGHGFGDQPPIGAWRSDDALACGALTRNVIDGTLGVLVMRRRVDHVWSVVADERNLTGRDEALARMEMLFREGALLEPVPPGVPARPALYDLNGRVASDVFKLLAQPPRGPAAWTLHQAYLAMPDPDPNWVGDCQTANFHTRLWEAQLLATFREQGLLVTQPHESPDFRIENRLGGEAWIEAVTANPPVPYNHANAEPIPAPTDRQAIFFGAAALRFAKTLGNKLDRGYARLPHVAGNPFVIALADFQAPSSMVWSREGLIGYLYGNGAKVAKIAGRDRAVPMPATHLLGRSAFPAGLFLDARQSDLSAVIFTNACSIGKFNRVAISGTAAPAGLRYTRIGQFFDRTPGALKGIPFCLDITSPEYRTLWPHGYEPWSAELEVFHNPFADHPLPMPLVPEAQHWFKDNGEIVCRSIYATSILWSRTLIQDISDPPPSLDAANLVAQGDGSSPEL